MTYSCSWKGVYVSIIYYEGSFFFYFLQFYLFLFLLLFRPSIRSDVGHVLNFDFNKGVYQCGLV